MNAKLLVALGLASMFAMAALLLVGGGAAVARAMSTPAAGAPAENGDDDVMVRTYCETMGGTIVERTAMHAGEEMGEAEPFCEFTGGAGADPADSRISVLAETLFTTEPTRAAMAYREQAAWPDMSSATPAAGIPNPASVYCAAVGGVEGEWVAMDLAESDPARTVAMCVFPDRSAIDSWGIAYHADGSGTIRGADLGPLFHWQPKATM